MEAYWLVSWVMLGRRVAMAGWGLGMRLMLRSRLFMLRGREDNMNVDLKLLEFLID